MSPSTTNTFPHDAEMQRPFLFSSASSETDEYDDGGRNEKLGLVREKKARASTIILNALARLKWPLFLCLQSWIIVLLYHSRSDHTEAATDVNGIVPKLSHQKIRFRNQLDTFTTNFTSDAQSLEVKNRWEELLPRGGGTVRIDDYERHPFLSEPIRDADKDRGPLYQVSWTHQLHCLYVIMDSYDQLLRHGPQGDEAQITAGHHSIHTSHCYDYLRQAILCTMDMTLEGSMNGLKTGTDGFGHMHVCRSYHEAVDWIEEHRVSDDAHIM